MRRKILMTLLFLGTVGGYASGIRSVVHHHHHGPAHCSGWSR